jgi:hypothetical protein|tara:strand:- start:1211 stop:1438 length:228 start_codon:yes stop_codon:yes gene_type:complete
MRIVVSEKQLGMLASYQSDLDEQESGDTGGSGTTAGSKGQWETGVSRGPDNQIGLTKWSDIVGSKISRGKANPLY